MLSDAAPSLFFNDVDPLRAELCASSLVRQSLASFKSPLSYGASDITVPKVYIACQNDESLPLPFQLSLGEAAGASIIQVPSGHSAFLRDDIIEEIIGAIGNLSEEC